MRLIGWRPTISVTPAARNAALLLRVDLHRYGFTMFVQTPRGMKRVQVSWRQLRIVR